MFHPATDCFQRADARIGSWTFVQNGGESNDVGRQFRYDANPITPESKEEARNVTVTFIDGEFDLGRRTITGPNGNQCKVEDVRAGLDEELEDDDEEDEEDSETDEEFDDDFDEEFDEEDDEEDEDDSEEEPG